MATTAMSAGDPMGAYPEAASGGILIDFFGNFVGLNYYDKEGTAFMPRSTILESVAGFPKTYARKYALSTPFRRGLGVVYILTEKKTHHQLKNQKKTILPFLMKRYKQISTGSSRISGCHFCDPEGQSALGGRFKRFSCYHPRWSAIGDSVYKEADKNRLRSRGYPFPAFEDLGMRLLCNFEEEFGEDLWS
uniref:Uncharacterized protein n=1 Tax=Triticum urartu TaxID=4572 RepID=A0A8R7UBW6_TRIUA